ncbi:hypothetical protein DFH08DRAFT_953640 [Mycena albidolilacea]|uniref:Uncharacterized protein n=1 Tax=Mycena albidolilacea TaxID=1033008 RepID=A0AAD7AH32_9AGAR|nr:hypothetical protein DFH08DRAFT_953640 [Mycena albidolilacea]
MPLFTNHHAMHINARHALCPEPLCTQFLPAPRQCQYGSNQGKYYVACFNKAHGPRYKFWDFGVHPRNALPPTQQNTAPPPAFPPAPPAAPLPSTQTATARPPPRQALNVYPVHAQETHRFTRPSHRPSTTTRQILDTGLADAATAFPAPRRCQHELPHQRLARQQEAAARLAALTPLPPSPTLSQEERDEALAVRLALGTSSPPSITAPHTRRVSVVSWVHCGEACTTVVQDVAGWALTWPTIHLTDLSPFLLSPAHSRLDAYYDFFNFRIGQWVAVPQAYTFNVITDEPILLRRVDTVTDDEDDVIASFTCFVNHNLYPVQLPTALSRTAHMVRITS